MKTIARWR